MGERLTIIGGSGFVGRAIARQAIEAGYQVNVACRHPSRSRGQLVEGVSLSRVDITDAKGLAEAVTGSDVVINLAGLLFEKGRQNFQSVHVTGTANVINACRDAGVKQLLHMSALGAGRVKESRYASTKAEAEALVKASGISHTIFRPSIIYGSGDTFFNKFKEMGAKLPVLPVISGDTRFQPVWVEDVARAFVCAIGNRHVNGAIFELGGPKSYSFSELMKMMLKALDIERPLISLPPAVASVMATFSQLLPTPPLTPDQLILLGYDNVIEGEPFPLIFGKPAELEVVLPGYICGNRAETLQKELDQMRSSYRKGSI